MEQDEIFQNYSSLINQEMDRIIKKQSQQIAQTAVSSWGQTPYGSSVLGQFTGDIYKQGNADVAANLTNFGINQANTQAGYEQQKKYWDWQGGQQEQQNQFTAGQSELDRQWQEQQLAMQMEMLKAQNQQPSFFQSLISSLAPGVGFALGGGALSGLGGLFGKGASMTNTLSPSFSTNSWNTLFNPKQNYMSGWGG